METRKRIVHAARDVFSELGYDAATFQAIAIRADLTRPAINHYFASKRDLYREVVAQTDELVVAAGIERARAETTLIGRLSAFIKVGATAEEPENRSAAAFLVVATLEAQRHPELSLGEDTSLLYSRKFLTWAVTDAIERGELITDADIPRLVEMLVAVLWGVGFYAGFVGNQQELEDMTEYLQRLLANKLWQLRE